MWLISTTLHQCISGFARALLFIEDVPFYGTVLAVVIFVYVEVHVVADVKIPTRSYNLWELPVIVIAHLRSDTCNFQRALVIYNEVD